MDISVPFCVLTSITSIMRLLPGRDGGRAVHQHSEGLKFQEVTKKECIGLTHKHLDVVDGELSVRHPAR